MVDQMVHSVSRPTPSPISSAATAREEILIAAAALLVELVLAAAWVEAVVLPLADDTALGEFEPELDAVAEAPSASTAV